MKIIFFSLDTIKEKKMKIELKKVYHFVVPHHSVNKKGIYR